MPLPHQVCWLPPNDEDEFDRMVRDALAVRYEKPNLVRLGRKGQAQNGIDGFDPSDEASVVYQATIQKDGQYGKLVSDLKKMDNEWPGKPQEFVYALGTPRDANLQRQVLELNKARRQANRSLIVPIFWDEIAEIISARPELRGKYYPWAEDHGAGSLSAPADKGAATAHAVIDMEYLIGKMMRIGIAPFHIARQLSGVAILDFIKTELGFLKNVPKSCSAVDLICPRTLISDGSVGLSSQQQSIMYARVGAGAGVFVDIVESEDEKRKEIGERIARARQGGETMIIMSSDDQIFGALGAARRDMKVIALTFEEDVPSALEGKSHASIRFGREINDAFGYSYPRYDITGFNDNKCAVLYSEADDRFHNTLAVSRSGMVHIIKNSTVDDRHERFRFEGFVAGNGYVGPVAASDEPYIKLQTENILEVWRRNMTGYIDWFPCG